MGSRPSVPSHAHMAKLYAVETIKRTVSIYIIYIRTKTKESHALATIFKKKCCYFFIIYRSELCFSYLLQCQVSCHDIIDKGLLLTRKLARVLVVQLKSSHRRSYDLHHDLTVTEYLCYRYLFIYGSHNPVLLPSLMSYPLILVVNVLFPDTSS